MRKFALLFALFKSSDACQMLFSGLARGWSIRLLFLAPTSTHLTNVLAPSPGNLLLLIKKNANARGSAPGAEGVREGMGTT